MSWPGWPATGVAPPTVVQGPVVTSVQSVSNPSAAASSSSQYTPEQWAQMQHNWQQWAQWQQQFQQWQQQYGAEYQKSMNAMSQTRAPSGQPVAPYYNVVAPTQPPLPVETKPPPPPDESQANPVQTPVSTSQYQNLQLMQQPPPLPQTAPTTVTTSSLYTSNQFSQPPPMFPNNFTSVPPPINQYYQQHSVPPKGYDINALGNNQSFAGNQSFPVNNNSNWHNYGNQPQGGFGVKRPINQQFNERGDIKRNRFGNPPEGGNWQGVDQAGNNKYRWDKRQQYNTMPATAKPTSDEPTDAEKKFDKQFAEWEAQFQKWKEQNAHHPDKNQYQEYENKWVTWRAQLLERREQMRRKRLGLIGDKSKISMGAESNSASTENQNLDQSRESGSGAIEDTQSVTSSLKNEDQSLDAVENVVIKSDETVQRKNSVGFLTATAGDGIPGLDLAGDGEERNKNFLEVDNNQKNKPDLEAISRGINNILGDQKLLNMLSLVSQTQPNKVTPGSPKFEFGGNIENDDLSNQCNLDDQSQGSVTTKNEPENFNRLNEGENASFNCRSFNVEADDPVRVVSGFHKGPDKFNYKSNQHDNGDGLNNTNRGQTFNRDSDNVGHRHENFNKETDTLNCEQDNFTRTPHNKGQNFKEIGNLNVNKGLPSLLDMDFSNIPGNLNKGPGNFHRNPDAFNRDLEFERGWESDNSKRSGDEFNSSSGSLRGGPGGVNKRGSGNFERGGSDNYDQGGYNFKNNSQGNFFQRGGQDKFPTADFDNCDRNAESSNRQDSGNFQRDELNKTGASVQDSNSSNFVPQNFRRLANDYDRGPESFNNKSFRSKNSVCVGNVSTSSNKFDLNKGGNKSESLRFEHPGSWSSENGNEGSIWKPSNVIDYEHKALKPVEPDILLVPLNMFDYRHKLLSRIPLPQRPKWLSDMVKDFPEFDVSIARSFDSQHSNQFSSKDRDRNFDEDRDRKFYDRDRKSYGDRDRKIDDRGRKSFDERDRKLSDNRDRKHFGERDRVFLDERDRKHPEDRDRSNFDERDRRNFNQRDRKYAEDKDRNSYSNERRDRDKKVSNDGDKKRKEDSDYRAKANWDQKDDESTLFGNRSTDEKSDSELSSKKKLDDQTKKSESLFKTDCLDDKTSNQHRTGKQNITLIEDLICTPGRLTRPPRIVIIMRGPPGSGKSHLAKLIKDKEVDNGGSAPRIICLDDYFMVEQDKEIDEDGKRVRVKEMVYEYEECMEASYRQSLMKSFKKTITDGYFSFIIVDNVNDKVKFFGEMWSFAKQNGFQVYICEMSLDVKACTKANIHGRSEIEIERCIAGWEPTPAHHPILDASSILQSENITEVDMEEVDSPQSIEANIEENLSSKWDTFDYSVDNLAKLDGISKPLRPSKTMEDFLQLDEWQEPVPTKPGQKRVRWADLEEHKKQEKMRAIGFVVGHTNWDRMMDPSKGSSALTQTKYIERYK